MNSSNTEKEMTVSTQQICRLRREGEIDMGEKRKCDFCHKNVPNIYTQAESDKMNPNQFFSPNTIKYHCVTHKIIII